jgi:hypothetical protein
LKINDASRDRTKNILFDMEEKGPDQIKRNLNQAGKGEQAQSLFSFEMRDEEDRYLKDTFILLIQ